MHGMGKGRKGKKKNVVKDKDGEAEDWCFVCKDGGDLRICDHKHCLKSYHAKCIGKDDLFLESEDHWTCDWHTCFNCHRASNIHCYTSKDAVCRRCFLDSSFLQVKGEKGFCGSCLKLVLLIEENKDYDSEGDTVDFTDLDSDEGLFMEYYMIIKKEEGFGLQDIYDARNRKKIKRNHQSGSDSEEFDDDDDEEEEEEEEEHISDDDDYLEYKKKSKRARKEKGCERHKAATQKPSKSSQMEFKDWASRSLMEFLTSIGKSTSEKLSQDHVNSIVVEYVKGKNLFHPKKKKMISCDEHLKKLFRKSRINRYRIYELLEAHLAENHEESEEDELGYDSEDNDAGISDACQRQRGLNMEKKSKENKLENDGAQSCFASIEVHNIKLVYLKRTVLYELLKQPESFTEKVIGCFVRVRSDPYDNSRKSYQLMQVKGVKELPVDEQNTDAVLLLSTMPEEIHISQLSNDDFSEEECEELKGKVLTGQLDRPTVVELQQKAKILHKDITKHWISKQLSLLQKKIDRANEKGWRRELFEYFEERKKLQSSSEQSRLFENVPTVIADLSEPGTNFGNTVSNMKNDESSPTSILQSSSFVARDGCPESRISDDKSNHGHAPTSESKQPLPKISNSEIKHENEPNRKPLQVISEDKRKCEAVIEVLDDDDDDGNANENKTSFSLPNHKLDDRESEKWFYLGPHGEQGQGSLSVLKKWHEKSPYASRFKVWKENQSKDDAVGLPEAINN